MTPPPTDRHPTDRDPTDRDPAVVLLARPARDRAPTATVWRLLTYDRHTRTPLADIARRWHPATTDPDYGDGSNGAIPEPVTRWVTAVLGLGAAITGPADDLAGPISWHVHPAPAPAPARTPDTAGATVPAGATGSRVLR